MSEQTVDLIRKDVQQAKNEAKKNILLPVREVSDLLALVDSLQQQLGEKDDAIVELHEYNRRYAADVDHLREQLAERERKIEWLTNELGE
ncbi:hypothetical protein [Paenibacillus polymyxa]|uniref:hypothetical protein n=1 Tax=Paenibacillus polymyxa TaxID=1406 RepID=UPI000737D22D|nr:hypothetical protein [Paenibacillus polymyxa]